MWGIVLIIVNNSPSTNFITGFTNKDDADAAADQIKKDTLDIYQSIYVSVIRIV
jgi:hypothetical protein